MSSPGSPFKCKQVLKSNVGVFMKYGESVSVNENFIIAGAPAFKGQPYFGIYNYIFCIEIFEILTTFSK